MQFHMESQCTKELNAELLWLKGESGSQRPAQGPDEPVKDTDVVPPLPSDLVQGHVSEPRLDSGPRFPPQQCFSAQPLHWDVRAVLKAGSWGMSSPIFGLLGQNNNN